LVPGKLGGEPGGCTDGHAGRVSVRGGGFVGGGGGGVYEREEEVTKSNPPAYAHRFGETFGWAGEG